MQIEPKSVEIVPAKTVEITEIVPVFYRELPTQKRLTVRIKGVERDFVFANGDYDALGQWTDDSIKEALRVLIGATIQTEG